MASALVLLVTGNAELQCYLRARLELDGYEVRSASAVEASRYATCSPAPEVVLLDGDMLEAMQTTALIRNLIPSVKVIVFSRSDNARAAVEAMRWGAEDYLIIPIDEQELERALQRSAPGAAQPCCVPASAFIEELGDDLFFLASVPAMRKLCADVQQLASVDVPVLILGESGTGKEIAARLLHQRSARSHRPFLKVNCAALPDDLIESELFGYEPGAFTGATHSKPGKFELCDKGTILLDEIGELPPYLQAKLLHVLQDQQFCRLGGRTTIRTDVRILAATNVDVPAAIASKRFRADLYYRLNAFTMRLPPLRERKEEIPLLLEQYMRRQARLFRRPPLAVPQSIVDGCMRYPWPGNLRELQNFVKRYLIMGDGEALTTELACLSQTVDCLELEQPKEQERPGDLKALVRGLKNEAEINAICAALEQSHWSRNEAARLLHISSKALRNKIRQYGIEAHSLVRDKAA